MAEETCISNDKSETMNSFYENADAFTVFIDPMKIQYWAEKSKIDIRYSDDLYGKLLWNLIPGNNNEGNKSSNIPLCACVSKWDWVENILMEEMPDNLRASKHMNKKYNKTSVVLIINLYGNYYWNGILQ